MSTKKILLLISLLPLLMGAARIQNESIKANAGINFSKLEALPSAQVLVGNASNVATPRDISGDATIANTGAMTIAANAVTDGKLRQSAGLSVIGRAANSTGDVADITAASDNQIFRRSGTSVGFGAIDISQSATIGTSILQEANGGTGQNSYLPGQVLIGDNSNGLTAAYLQAGSGISVTSGSGTITIAATGGSGSAEAVTKAIAQTGHGFAVGDVIRHNGTIYVEAQADADANAEVYGIVSAVADANNFTVTTSGYISGLSGLTAGAAHFLSATTAGAITATEPTGVNQVSKPVLVAVSTSAGYVIHSRGFIVGSGGGSGGSAVAGEAYFAATAGCEPPRSSSTFGAPTDDADCPGPTIVSEYLGDWQTTDSNNLSVTINSLPAGKYLVIFNGYVYGTAASTCSWYISDGTTNGSMVSNRFGSSQQPTGTSTLIVEYASSGNRTFQPRLRTNDASTCGFLNYDSSNSAFFETRMQMFKIED